MKQKEGKAKFCPLLMPELRRLQFSIGNRVSVVPDSPPPPPPPPKKKKIGAILVLFGQIVIRIASNLIRLNACRLFLSTLPFTRKR